MAFAPSRDCCRYRQARRGRRRPRLCDRIHADQCLTDLAVNVLNGFADPAPQEAVGSASRSSTASRVPVDAPEGTAARPPRAAIQDDVDLHGGVAAAVENLTSYYVTNLRSDCACHVFHLSLRVS